MSYANMIRDDGGVNRSVVRATATRRATAECNMTVCVLAGIEAPSWLRFGVHSEWYAQQAQNIDPQGDRFSIFREVYVRERRNCLEWVRALHRMSPAHMRILRAPMREAA